MADPQHLALLREGVEQWNRWRHGLGLVRPDLVGADLGGMGLKEANLQNVDLGAANLSGANLRRANLSFSNFSGTNLSEADLRGGHLEFSDFTAANFQGADIGGATLGWNVFANTNLNGAKGLEDCQHIGPSSMGIDTFFKTKGGIPESFLRGCGVPKPLVAQMMALVGAISPIQYYSCFISYSHADKTFARRLEEALRGCGIQVYRDEKRMLPGDDIQDEVDGAINNYDKVLLCCSKHSLTSWWVDDEVGKALAKEQALWRQRKKKVLVLIPLNLDGYVLSENWNSGKASQVRGRLAGDFQGWKRNDGKFDEQVGSVIRALRVDPAARERPPASKL